MRKRHASGISRKQFEQLKPFLESAHPRKGELYEIFCAVLYMLKSGWRMLPEGFPR